MESVIKRGEILSTVDTKSPFPPGSITRCRIGRGGACRRNIRGVRTGRGQGWRDLISRFYRAPDWGDDVRPLPPNEAHAQRVEQVVQKRMQPLERRIVDAEYV